ncbi:hypothetical protein THAOC_29982, partial [Thalassiosira oceanica]
IVNKVSSAGRIIASQYLGGACRRTTAALIPTPSHPQATPPTFQLAVQRTSALARETATAIRIAEDLSDAAKITVAPAIL